MIRTELKQLLSMAPLSSASAPNVALLEQQGALVLQLTKPATDEEACAAIALFGEDGSFGLAWSVVTFVESAPGWPIWECIRSKSNDGVDLLRERLANAGYSDPGIAD